jgi:hypothetical protein
MVDEPGTRDVDERFPDDAAGGQHLREERGGEGGGFEGPACRGERALGAESRPVGWSRATSAGRSARVTAGRALQDTKLDLHTGDLAAYFLLPPPKPGIGTPKRARKLGTPQRSARDRDSTGGQACGAMRRLRRWSAPSRPRSSGVARTPTAAAGPSIKSLGLGPSTVEAAGGDRSRLRGVFDRSGSPLGATLGSRLQTAERLDGRLDGLWDGGGRRAGRDPGRRGPGLGGIGSRRSLSWSRP